jgi:hypothetical protein
MIDGGVVALSGYLYQLLGTSSCLAAAGTDSWAVIHLEHNGEDALLRSEAGSALIQFKYSSRQEKLAPGDLAEILAKFEEHDNDDKSLRWRLVSNREYSPATDAILNGVGDPSLANVKLANRQTISRLKDRFEYTHISLVDINARLTALGREFGLNDDEIRQGAENLVGAMVIQLQQKGAGVPISIAFLDDHLVGFEKPGRLTGAARCDEIGKELAKYAGWAGPLLHETVARTSLRNILLSPSPVVVVVGPGGSGKTLSVLRVLQQHVVAEKCLAVALLSDEADTFTSVVARWRHPSVDNPTPETFDVSLRRLMVANPMTEAPIVFVNLDGLDEDGWKGDRWNQARNLLRRALGRVPGMPSRSDRVKIIVTCRQRQDIGNILAEDGTGRILSDDGPDYISLGEFDEAEFRAVWDLWFRELPIPNWPNRSTEIDSALQTDSLGAYTNATTESEQRVIEVLRSPALLGCFRQLPPEARRALLDGNAQAWADLMKAHLDWFKERVHRRHGFAQDAVISMLRAIAAATNEDFKRMHHYQQHWIDPAVKEDGAFAGPVRRLFRDAVTTGIVVTDQELYQMTDRTPVPWRWRYAFVPEYLCSLP